MPQHPALAAGGTAIVTGAASGIGLAAAQRLAGLGLNVCLADRSEGSLPAAAASVAALAPGGEESVMSRVLDVADVEQLRQLRTDVHERFGAVAVLMNNAGIGAGGSALEDYDGWRRVLDVNLWGVINGVQVFAPGMIEAGAPGLIVNTGSKQGITTPPGNTAYNVSKAGVKVLTEGLQHSLRSIEGCQVTAHLFVPGWVYTDINPDKPATKPDAAWTAEQTVDFMLDSVQRGDFYIICPDNDVPRALDERRIRWAAEDIIQNRPPLSRWHPDYKDAFAAFVQDEG